MRVSIVGADGKMGQQLIQTVSKTKNAELFSAIVQKDSNLLGKEVSVQETENSKKIYFSDEVEQNIKNSDVVIDFTRPEGSLFYGKIAAKYKIAHIIGTTGFSQQDFEKLYEYAKENVIVQSGNMSYGVNLLAALVKKAASLLKSEDFDIEISEMHHRSKVDAPSGTALLLGAAAAQGREQNLENVERFSQNELSDARELGTIGFSSQRGGTVIGDHHVIFAGENERLVLSHLAQDRSIFAQGALKAAFWAIKQKAGLYSMEDVLEI